MPPRKRPVKKRRAKAAAGPSLEMYFPDYLRYLEAECGMTGNTIQAYSSDLKQFFEWYRSNGPSQLSKVDLKLFSRYLGHLNGRGFNSSTVSRHIVSIKVYFRFLVLEGVLLESKAEMLSSPKLWAHLPKVLSPKKVDELLAAPCSEDRFPLRDRALLAMMYATGCRASEMTGMRLIAVYLDEGYCRCLGKGNKERMVSLNPVAISAVEAYMEHERSIMVPRKGSEWLFVTKSGHQLSRIMVWNLIKKYAARIGCSSDVSPHTLRHSFATHMLAGGAEIRALQEILGHASIRTTQIYTHVEHSRLKSLHQQFHPRA